MTAVQWALDQQHTLFALRELGGIDDYEYFNKSAKILEKAMEMEKDQIIESYCNGCADIIKDENIFPRETSEQYYNETFKSE